MKTILSAAIGAMLALSTVQARAQVQAKAADRKVELVIEQQSLADALNEWAKQTGLQLVSQSSETMNSTVAPKIKGAYTAKGALEELLKGTSLTYEWVGERAVAIREKALILPAALQSEGPDKKEAVLPIARFNGETSGQRRVAANDQSSTGATPSAGDRARLAANYREELEEIVVTGSRLKRRSNDTGPVPVTTFSRADIDRLGVANLADILRYVPQQPFAANDNDATGASRVARLRGLGVGTTLVLINGRRTITSAVLGSTNAFDLNTIPLAAVDRVEVVADSASAVYGADAIGGVINVILKQDIGRTSVDAYAGGASGGAEEYRVSLTAGHSNERFRGSIVLDGFQRDFLHGQDREFYANQDFRRFGGSDLRFPLANPGNIFSLDGSNLPGLSSDVAGVPPGSSGQGLTPDDFLGTAGVLNVDSFLRFQSVVPAAERLGASGWGELTLSPSIRAFGEILYAQREDRQLLSPPFVAFEVVPDTNAFNPFGVPVAALYLATGVGNREIVTDVDSLRSVVGLTGQISEWDWEVSLLDIREEGTQHTLNEINPSALADSLASADPDSALNVFQDGPGGSAALLSSLRAVPVDDKFSSDGSQLSAFMRGPSFTMLGERSDLVLGMEARTEKLDFDARSLGVQVTADRDSYAGYVEWRVPLVSEAMQLPMLRNLSVTAAARYDHYSDFGGTVNPQYGLQWYPWDRLLVRASYSTSFRAPSLYELYSPGSTFDLAITDPSRAEDVLIPVTRSGNPNLEPEEATSRTVGFVFNPLDRSALRVSATYWWVEQDRRVQSLSPELFLANEASFASRVQRAAPTAEDIASGRPGALQSIDASSVNFGRAETSGVDCSVSSRFEFPIGVLTPTIALTYIDTFETADFPNVPPRSRVGIAYTQGTIPRTRATSTLGWERGGVAFGATLRYLSSYDDATDLDEPNGRTIEDQTIVDLQAALDLAEIFGSTTWLQGTVVRAGVTNLLDHGPRFSEVGGRLGFDPSQTDVRQRFIYMTVGKAF